MAKIELTIEAKCSECGKRVEVPPLFIQVLRELDLYLEITKNLLTDSQLDHVSTVGSQLTTTGDIPSAITLRD